MIIQERLIIKEQSYYSVQVAAPKLCQQQYKPDSLELEEVRRQGSKSSPEGQPASKWQGVLK